MTNLTEAIEGTTKGEVFTSFDVDAFETPGGRDEIWRFTPLRRLRGLHDGSAPATGAANIAVTERDGVQVERVRRGDARLGEAGVPADRIAAQAFSSFTEATIVTAGADADPHTPIEVTVTGPGAGAVAYGHLQLRVTELAEATVVIDLRGGGTYADNVEFVVADAARLTVVWIADWDADMVHVSMHHATLGKDAVLRHAAVQLGGELVRLTGRVGYTGPGGDAELLGLYFADDGQHLESRLLIDHSTPDCRSHVMYKGALQGDPDSSSPMRAPCGWATYSSVPRPRAPTPTSSTATSSSPTGLAPTRSPTWRSSAGRSSAPGTPVPPDVSTTSNCSTCWPAGSPRTRHAD